MAFYLLGNSLLFNIGTANSAIYGDLHAADWYVPEAAMHYMPATFNDSVGWGDIMKYFFI